jgi:hypothetical protein
MIINNFWLCLRKLMLTEKRLFHWYSDISSIWMPMRVNLVLLKWNYSSHIPTSTDNRFIRIHKYIRKLIYSKSIILSLEWERETEKKGEKDTLVLKKIKKMLLRHCHYPAPASFLSPPPLPPFLGCFSI